jgi:uncharacterized RDD family membrane protein YckC
MQDETASFRPYPTDDAWSHATTDRQPDPSIRWRRPVARALDMTILVGPVVWVFWALAGPPPPPGVDDYRLMFQIFAGIASFVWLGVCWPIYEALAIGMYGRTFGKWVTGVCVVSTDGTRLPAGRLIGRTALVVTSFVVTFFIALRLWFIDPPLAAIAPAALVLSQILPALFGGATWVDQATGSDVVRWGRQTGRPPKSLPGQQYWSTVG